MAIDICYLVSHGFASRMLLQTRLIDNLLNRGLSVAIVSTDSNDPNFEVYHGKVELIDWRSSTSIWDDDYLHKRMYYLENIHGNPALLEKFHNGLFFSNSKHPWKRIRPLVYYLVFLLVKVFPSIRTSFLKQESRHLKSEEAVNIVRSLMPKLVISTYPVSIMEAKLLYAAKNAGVYTVLHLLSWDNISCKGRFPVLPDSFIAWGGIMEEELVEYYGVDKKKITKCGVPHFDEHVQLRGTNRKDEYLLKLGLSPEFPYFFFAMSSPRFAPNEIDIVERLARKVSSGEFGNRMQLIVRPHPQNISTHMAKKSWINRLEELVSKRVAVDFPEMNDSEIRWSLKKSDMTRYSALLSGCTVCVNSGSTASIDALMHLKPVVFTSFDGDEKRLFWDSARRLVSYNHLRKFIEEGGAEVTSNYQELVNALKRYQKNPEHRHEERRQTLKRECYLDDGGATQRVANCIEKIVSEL